MAVPHSLLEVLQALLPGRSYLLLSPFFKLPAKVILSTPPSVYSLLGKLQWLCKEAQGLYLLFQGPPLCSSSHSAPCAPSQIFSSHTSSHGLPITLSLFPHFQKPPVSFRGLSQMLGRRMGLSPGKPSSQWLILPLINLYLMRMIIIIVTIIAIANMPNTF